MLKTVEEMNKDRATRAIEHFHEYGYTAVPEGVKVRKLKPVDGEESSYLVTKTACTCKDHSGRCVNVLGLRCKHYHMALISALGRKLEN